MRHNHLETETYNTLHLQSILEGDGVEKRIFSDELFTRKVIKSNLNRFECEVITDTWQDIACHYVSLSTETPTMLQIRIEGGDGVESSPDTGVLVRRKGRIYWFPQLPVVRMWDSQGRIKDELETGFNWQADFEDNPSLVGHTPNGMLEFPIIEFRDNIDAYAADLTSINDLERRSYSQYSYFKYGTLKDLWTYLIRGQVFDPRYKRRNGYRKTAQEQAALALYNLTGFLGTTNKRIYEFLQHEIAYSALLRLEEDGRWRHGRWTHGMETHIRFQSEGIQLLLAHYDKTGQPVFLEGAERAAAYLLKISDNLTNGGIWFLHDSLEKNERTAKVGYPSMVRSKAFGKSNSNTLCLNTHLSALYSLDFLHRQTGQERYRAYFDRGFEAAKDVLSANPSSCLFSALYLLRRFGISLDTRQSTFAKRADNLFRRVFRAALKRMKAIFPRLVMPNGFIERDLTASAVSLRYHLVNLKDLLVLYACVPEAWILSLVERGIEFALDEKNISYLQSQIGSLAATFMEVLALHGERHEDIATAALHLHDDGLVPPLDLYAARWVQYRTELAKLLQDLDARLIPIALKRGEMQMLVNPTWEVIAPGLDLPEIAGRSFVVLTNSHGWLNDSSILGERSSYAA